MSCCSNKDARNRGVTSVYGDFPRPCMMTILRSRCPGSRGRTTIMTDCRCPGCVAIGHPPQRGGAQVLPWVSPRHQSRYPRGHRRQPLGVPWARRSLLPSRWWGVATTRTRAVALVGAVSRDVTIAALGIVLGGASRRSARIPVAELVSPPAETRARGGWATGQDGTDAPSCETPGTRGAHHRCSPEGAFPVRHAPNTLNRDVAGDLRSAQHV
jgi:hypothetical protein